MKRKKGNGMAMFVFMNAVKKYAPQPSNVHVHHKKQTSVR